MSAPLSLHRFILLPGLVSLICYGCSRTPEIAAADLAIDSFTERQGQQNTQNQHAQIPTSESTQQVEPQPVVEVTPIVQTPSSSVAYREGINLASSAYQLSEAAISPDDWGLIASRWRRAAEQLGQVAADDKNYEVAQSKIADYIRSAEHAEARVDVLKKPVSVAIAPKPTPVSRQASPAPTALLPPLPPSPSAPISSGSVTVPVVRRLHGTPIVRVTFNNAKSYEMILDTGASRTLITRTMANELGVIANERMVASTASEAEVVFELGKVEAISMGGITLNNASVSIGDSVSVGLLGNDFLNGYDVTIRGRENVVELMPSR